MYSQSEQAKLKARIMLQRMSALSLSLTFSGLLSQQEVEERQHAETAKEMRPLSELDKVRTASICHNRVTTIDSGPSCMQIARRLTYLEARLDAVVAESTQLQSAIARQPTAPEARSAETSPSAQTSGIASTRDVKTG
jgi:hypothetical protein